MEDDWLKAALDWVAGEGGALIRMINATTLGMVQEAIQAGLEEGQSIDEIMGELQEMWPELSRVRAERIARTEVIRASNFAAMEGARSTGLVVQKVWISANDDRTRRRPRDKFDHRVMDGVRVPLDEPFDVQGEMMLQPLDASLGASAGNIINCRCTVGFLPEEDDE